MKLHHCKGRTERELAPAVVGVVGGVAGSVVVREGRAVCVEANFILSSGVSE